MNKEFFDALKLLKQEKNIDLDALTERIKNAITIAIKKDYGNIANILIDLDIERGIFSVTILKDVVEVVEDEVNQISLQKALKHDTGAKIGYPVRIDLDPKQFGRIAALSAKHVIKQGIRDAEKDYLYESFKDKENKVISAIVNKIDPRRSLITLLIDSFELILPKAGQLPNETFVEGDVIKIYVAQVTKTEKGPQIVITRNSPELVRYLFEKEIPEIKNGIIEIKSVAREAGMRTKIAVHSNNESIDPVGSCVGAKGVRVNKIVEELGGEKIDIIEYSEDYIEYISNALSPATIKSVMLDPSMPNSCYVIVPDNQLSLAIGNKGQNVRLSAKLTGWKIDIKPEKLIDEVRDEIERRQLELEEMKKNESEKEATESVETCDDQSEELIEETQNIESDVNEDNLINDGHDMSEEDTDDIELAEENIDNGDF